MAADDGSVVLRIKRKRTEDPLDALRKENNWFDSDPILIISHLQNLKEVPVYVASWTESFSLISSS